MEELLAKIRRSLPRYGKEDVPSNKVCQGTVLWLPPYNRVTQRPLARTGLHGLSVTHKRGGTVDSGILDHPIMVISRDVATPKSIDFLVMTSFGKRPLQTRFERLNDPQRGDYLAVDQAPRHPYTLRNNKPYDRRYVNLKFKRGYNMPRKPSYVHISMVYTMHLEDAGRFWGFADAARAQYELDDVSFRMLRRVMGDKAPSYRLGAQHHVSALEERECRDSEMRSNSLWWRAWEYYCLLLMFVTMGPGYGLGVCVSHCMTTAVMWYA